MILDLAVMHGCQNRFAIVDEDVTPIAEAHMGELVLAMADRIDVHGVLFLSGRRGPRMRIFDRDGTEATMCGNGIRCAARYFHDRGVAGGCAFTIATRDGDKRVALERGAVAVGMGPAREYRRLGPDRYFAFTGIPHLVLLGACPSIDAARREGRRLRFDRALGSAVGYPDGLHVNFVRVRGDGGLDVLTYEAGVEDVTPACGTGSTAAAYVCARLGLVSAPVRVRLPGGELWIEGDLGPLTMRGPAEYLPSARLAWEEHEPAEVATCASWLPAGV